MTGKKRARERECEKEREKEREKKFIEQIVNKRWLEEGDAQWIKEFTGKAGTTSLVGM